MEKDRREALVNLCGTTLEFQCLRRECRTGHHGTIEDTQLGDWSAGADNRQVSARGSCLFRANLDASIGYRRLGCDTASPAVVTMVEP